MSNAGAISSVVPGYAIPGGEITIECDGFQLDPEGEHGAYVNGMTCVMVAASPTRVLALVPDCSPGEAVVHLESGGAESTTADVVVGEKHADGMHIVANPAIDPSDDAIIVTRSGSRGQQLPNTIFRIETDGYIDELPDAIMNPTGIAFDTEGVMYVGDRSGTIYRVPEFATVEEFASLEPSVAAYHLAFGQDGRLYVSAPGLSSNDSIYAIDGQGAVESFASGFGRPQGLAFDREGYLYAAGCHNGRRGIFRIDPDGLAIEHFVAGNNIVGLCFTRKGQLIAATNDSVYSIKAGIYGTLLPAS